MNPFNLRLSRASAVLVLAITSIILLSVLVRVYPYLTNNYDFEIGYDTGLYERFVDFYNVGPWDNLPAYPDLPPAYQPITSSLEPGFFVVASAATSMSGADAQWLFRYYFPSIAGISLVLVTFVAGRAITRKDFGGVFAASLVAVSYVQVWAVNESYYRQIFATFLLVLSLVYLDRYIEGRNRRNLIAFTLLASGTVAFHMPVALLVAMTLTFLFLYFGLTKRKDFIRPLVASTAGIVILSIPSWAPRINDLLSMLVTAATQSTWRASTLLTGRGLWEAGGAIPGILWSFPHVLVGYIIIFCPVTIMAIAGYIILRKQGRLHYAIPALSLILWVYIGFWLFFGNRMLINLDLLLCVISPLVLVYLYARYKSPLRRWSLIVVIVSVVFLANLSIVTIYQQQNGPYITSGLEGVQWIKDNVNQSDSVIFGPDYLSSDVAQLGFSVSIWDYSLVGDYSSPRRINEQFLLEAPSNLSFLQKFFSVNPGYLQKDIYVLWGTDDLTKPLTYANLKIPFDQYSVSPYFKIEFSGSGDLLSIYKYVGPR
jgi:hypothetical protein